MDACFKAIQAGSRFSTYLEELVRVHFEILGEDLTALYLHGSLVQDDFKPESSDIDILGVVAGPISTDKRSELAVRLSHEMLPVPAFGLELILCELDDLRVPAASVPYGFALSTGKEWGLQVETEGSTSDILVHMQLCRQAGVALVGAPAFKLFADIPAATLRKGLLGELKWHRDDLQIRPSAQSITNAVLNAARSLHAAETCKIISKTAGARWWLNHTPQDEAVVMALNHRNGRSTKAPSLQLAQDFVELAIEALN